MITVLFPKPHNNKNVSSLSSKQAQNHEFKSHLPLSFLVSEKKNTMPIMCGTYWSRVAMLICGGANTGRFNNNIVNYT